MGFFFAETAIKKPKLFSNLAKAHSCLVCPLNTNDCATPKSTFTGSKTPLIYILGESFQDFEKEAGELLKICLAKSISLEKVRFSNIINCAVPGKIHEDFEVECCRSVVEKDIETTNPKIIVGLGGQVLKWALKQGGNISQWRGKYFPLEINKQPFWFYPIFSPSFVIKRRTFSFYKTEFEKIFELDVQGIVESLKTLKQPVVEQKEDYFQGVTLITKPDQFPQLKEAFDYFSKQKKVSLDIETTGFSPYNNNTLLSVALSDGVQTIAFPFNYNISEDKPFWEAIDVKKELQDFLFSSGIKICQNTKFDLGWLYYLYGKDVVYKTEWADTMSQAYTLDERTSTLEGMMNLDILCRINLGFWLKSISNLDASNLLQYPLEKILKYNAIDAKYTYKLHEIQEKKLSQKEGKGLQWTNSHLVEVAKTLLLTQANGVYVSQETVKNYIKPLKEILEKVKNELSACKEIIEYNKIHAPFNPGSHKNISVLFKDFLHLALDKDLDENSSDEELEVETTTDKNTLLKYVKQGVQIASLIIEYRETTKLLGTYLERYDLENPECYIEKDGILRPQFTHCFTGTGRLSGQTPNLQNAPKRKNKYVRNIVIAPEGYKFVALDFCQIEARCIAFSSKDEVFCEAIRNNYDIHKERALRICELYPEAGLVKDVKEFEEFPKKLKVFRDIVKNKFTFPLFYGASYKSIAKALKIPEEISKKVCAETFSRFSGVKKWQKELLAFYDKHGYIESLIGRRRHGPLKMNAVLNSPIQSIATDIMLVAMNNLSKASYKLNKAYLQPILSIHDDLSFYLPETVLEEEIYFIAKELCRIPFDFINVPLSVEVSIGQSWGELEELCTFSTTDFDYSH